MDIYERLKKDHDKQRELGKKIVETQGDSDDRRELWEAYKVELEAHASAEEQTFYAELMACPEASDQTRHSVSEHKEAADLVEEIDKLDMASPQWLQKFKQLKHDIEHHVDEEEADVFPLAKKHISSTTADDLAARFNDRKPSEKENERDAA